MEDAGDMNDIPHGSVVITPSDMYRKLEGVEASVNRLMSVMDPAIERLREETTEVKLDVERNRSKAESEHEKLESRINVLEAWRWMLVGIAIAASTIASYVIPALRG